MSEDLTDADLGAIVDALDSRAVREIQGFHYAPNYVIRDCMRQPGHQVIWTGPDSMEDAAFARQCEIERLRVALAIALTRPLSQARADALAQGRREGLEEAKLACVDLSDAYRETGEHHMGVGPQGPLSILTKAAEALAWARGATECAYAVGKLLATAPAETQKPETGEVPDA